jgi:fructose-bisphosphate aldolase class II
MTLATLAEVLQPALGGYAVGGLVCLGWEDMRAYVAAAEAENAPVILQAGPSCREHTPLPVLGAMMRHLAENASVPVVSISTMATPSRNAGRRLIAASPA